MSAQESLVILTKRISTLKEMESFAIDIAQKLFPGDIIYLFGDLGVGKTTFAQFSIRSLLSANLDVTSPTFTIENLYDTGNFPIWHVDLYRIENEKEIGELAFRENTHDSISYIEWPEKLGSLLEHRALGIFLTEENGVRTICCKGTKSWKVRLANLDNIDA